MKLFFYYSKRSKKRKKMKISFQKQRKSFSFQPAKHLHNKDFILKTLIMQGLVIIEIKAIITTTTTAYYKSWIMPTKSCILSFFICLCDT